MSTATELATTDELPPGTPLAGGALVIDDVIGRGGVATVYSATRPDGTKVAVKVLLARFTGDRTIQRRLENELLLGESLADLPCIVRALDIGRLPELGGRMYMVQELVVGPTLALRLARGPLPIPMAVGIARDVAAALALVHERGVIHRDVKPANIMLEPGDAGPRVRLLDLGFAYSTGAAAAPATAGLTSDDDRPGTKHYMAPEQALGLPPTPQFDVYALAVTLYELLVGVPPHWGHAADDVVRRKCDSRLPPLSIEGQRGDLPAALVAVVDAGLQREPELRITSAAAFRDRLDEVLAAMRKPIAGDVSTPGVLVPLTRAEPAGDHRIEPASLRDVATDAPLELAASRRPRGPWLIGGGAVVLAATLWSLADDGSDKTGLDADVPLGPAASDERDPRSASVSAAPTVAAVPAQPRIEHTEPVTVPAPQEAVAPAPTQVAPETPAKPSAPRPARAAPKSTPAGAETGECVAMRAEAAAAVQSRKWATVLDHTRERKCWPDTTVRLQHRTRALRILKDYEGCVREGKGSTDPIVAPAVEFCRQQLEVP